MKTRFSPLFLALAVATAPVALVAAQDNDPVIGQYSEETCDTLNRLLWDLQGDLMRIDDNDCWTPTCVSARLTIIALEGKIRAMLKAGNCAAYDRTLTPAPAPGSKLGFSQ